VLRPQTDDGSGTSSGAVLRRLTSQEEEARAVASANIETKTVGGNRKHEAISKV